MLVYGNLYYSFREFNKKKIWINIQNKSFNKSLLNHQKSKDFENNNCWLWNHKIILMVTLKRKQKLTPRPKQWTKHLLESLHPFLLFCCSFARENVPLVLLKAVNLPSIMYIDVEAGVCGEEQIRKKKLVWYKEIPMNYTSYNTDLTWAHSFHRINYPITNSTSLPFPSGRSTISQLSRLSLPL